MQQIENLYSVFEKYTINGIHHCDCIDEKDVKKLHSKQLRELIEDDLVSYHGSALYTWGGIEHYKHFLPRICELITKNRQYSFVDLGEIYLKLEYSDWQNWSETEINAIKEYVIFDWIELVNNYKSEISISVLEYYSKYIDVTGLIENWNLINSQNGLRNFVYFFFYNGTEIMNRGIKINGKKYMNEFASLLNNAEIIIKLENEFFEKENTDFEYVEKISIVLQMIEQNLI